MVIGMSGVQSREKSGEWFQISWDEGVARGWFEITSSWIARHEVLLPINYVNNKMREIFYVNGRKKPVKI